ncbi:hypothetical protein [Actinomadura sp. HBU206391]|uniref:hypothetical protein n=1 Tax=Actinomadura sp. HBU206391 TaxID=2731692 RepID=UPI001C9C7A69|nr:hypothetical protein [Actinomadura sp. HBU206391]
MQERQLGGQKVRFTPTDRAFLAALLYRLTPAALRRMRLLMRPDTVLRWHRDLIARAARSRPKRPGRPPTVRSIRVRVLRLVRENPSWGYRRVHGELLVLGVKVAASAVWEILKDAGIDPAPERVGSTWTDFLRSHALFGLRLPGNRHPDRNAHVHTGGDRAPNPPGPHPGRDRAPDRLMG